MKTNHKLILDVQPTTSKKDCKYFGPNLHATSSLPSKSIWWIEIFKVTLVFKVQPTLEVYHSLLNKCVRFRHNY